MSDRFYREKSDDVVLRLSVMDAKALRNQLRGIADPPIIVTHVLAVLAEQITKAEATS